MVSLNQNICYIIIIPAFGVVSQVIAHFSNKPIFGQNGPKTKVLATNYMQEFRNMIKEKTNYGSYHQYYGKS